MLSIDHRQILEWSVQAQARRGDVEAIVCFSCSFTHWSPLFLLPYYCNADLGTHQASLLTCIATSATWCFCTAAGSLLSACCGNDKPSTVAAGPSSGRKRSVALLFCSIILQIVFQYGLAPTLAGDNSADFDFDAWISGCEQYLEGNVNANKLLLESCVGNYANYRVAAATTLFFVLAALAAALKPTANREAWPAKFVLWLFLVVGFVFIDSDPTFSDVYLNVARGKSLSVVSASYASACYK